MGLRGWLLIFFLMIVVIFISAALMKWLQNAATSVPKPRRKDEDNNG